MNKPTIKIEQCIVTGIKWWHKKTGEPYTIVFYDVPIPSQYGVGVEGKHSYLSGHVENFKIGDSVFFNYAVGFDGKPYVKSVTVLKES